MAQIWPNVSTSFIDVKEKIYTPGGCEIKKARGVFCYDEATLVLANFDRGGGTAMHKNTSWDVQIMVYTETWRTSMYLGGPV